MKYIAFDKKEFERLFVRLSECSLKHRKHAVDVFIETMKLNGCEVMECDDLKEGIEKYGAVPKIRIIESLVQSGKLSFDEAIKILNNKS